MTCEKNWGPAAQEEIDDAELENVLRGQEHQVRRRKFHKLDTAELSGLCL